MSTVTLKKKEYTGIDLAKLLCAFLVVAIHAEPFRNNVWLDRGLGIITRFPVPFFFTAAGYFLFLPGLGTISGKRLLNYLKRLLILYGIWSLFYLPFYLQTLKEFNNSTLILKDFIRSVLLTGINSHLWFLAGNIFAATLVWVCIKYLKPKKTLILSAILLVIGILCSTYEGVILSLFGSKVFWILRILEITGTRNGLFYGFFYVAMGAFIATKENNTDTTPVSKYVVGLILSVVALGLESIIGLFVLHASQTILWFCTVPAVFFLFMIAKNINIPIRPIIMRYVRNISTLIYTSQFIFIYLFVSLGIGRYGMKMYMITVFTSTLFSIIIIRLSKSIHVFKYLY